MRHLTTRDEAASHYEDIIVALRAARAQVPTNDAWIAALAAREGAMVPTFDVHFERVRGVACRVLTR